MDGGNEDDPANQKRRADAVIAARAQLTALEYVVRSKCEDSDAHEPQNGDQQPVAGLENSEGLDPDGHAHDGTEAFLDAFEHDVRLKHDNNLENSRPEAPDTYREAVLTLSPSQDRSRGSGDSFREEEPDTGDEQATGTHDIPSQSNADVVDVVAHRVNPPDRAIIYIDEKDGRRLRRVLYGVTLLAASTIVVSLGIVWRGIPFKSENLSTLRTDAPTSVPSEQPSAFRYDIYDVLFEIAGPDIYDMTKPEGRAAKWIAEVDLRKLRADSVNLEQRFVLAVFFFSGADEADPTSWKNCRPPTPFLEAHDTLECQWKVPIFAEKMFYGNKTRHDNTWLSSAHECSWMGILCTSRDGTVLKIVMLANNNTGTLPSLLGRLPLRKLSLGSNRYTGTIPTFLGNLTDLRRFFLENNRLSGAIPTELYQLSKLRYLNFGLNKFVGTLSHLLRKWKWMKELRIFGLDDLVGSIPSQIGRMRRLEKLILGNNRLTGTIPSELGSCEELKELYLLGNEVSGPLPIELKNLAKLKKFRADQNSISGTIPAELFLGWQRTTLLFLNENSLVGSLPTTVGSATNLAELYLHDNAMTGTIPSEVANLQYLKRFRLEFNFFTGTVPCMPNVNDFGADCAVDSSSAARTTLGNGDGYPLVRCDCCTFCCSRESLICS